MADAAAADSAAPPVRKFRLEWHLPGTDDDGTSDVHGGSAGHRSAAAKFDTDPPPPFRRVRLEEVGGTATVGAWAELLTTGFDGVTEAWVDRELRGHPQWDACAVVLAEHPDEPGRLAAAAIAWMDEPGAEWGRVHWVAVAPRHRRCGLGRWLVQCVLDRHVNVNGVDRVYLRTEDFREAAIKLYLACEFALCGAVE